MPFLTEHTAALTCNLAPQCVLGQRSSHTSRISDKMYPMAPALISCASSAHNSEAGFWLSNAERLPDVS